MQRHGCSLLYHLISCNLFLISPAQLNMLRQCLHHVYKVRCRYSLRAYNLLPIPAQSADGSNLTPYPQSLLDAQPFGNIWKFGVQLFW